MLIRRSKAVVPTPLMGRDMLMIPRYAGGGRCQAKTQVVSAPIRSMDSSSGLHLHDLFCQSCVCHQLDQMFQEALD